MTTPTDPTAGMPRCPYPGCGAVFPTELHRICHEAVYDNAAHARRREAFLAIGIRPERTTS